MEKEQGGSGVVVKGRATIDTRPPFRSVREAVALFGERVLVGEIYAKQLKEIQVTKKATTMEDKENVSSKIGIVSAELEETKQNLQKTREEGNYMANCLKSLKQELEETKRELRSLKSTKEHPKLVALNPEIEELKYVEVNPNNVVVTTNYNDHQQEFLFQKKKVVTFASPPSLTREINESRSSSDGRGAITSKLGRTSSFRKEEKKKKKAVVSVVGWLFPKKKRGNNNNEEGDHHARSPNTN